MLTVYCFVKKHHQLNVFGKKSTFIVVNNIILVSYDVNLIYQNCFKCRTLPQMSPGPLSPGLNVTIDQTVPENSTGLPGFTFITPVTTTSSVPGQKQLCLNIHNQKYVFDKNDSWL